MNFAYNIKYISFSKIQTVNNYIFIFYKFGKILKCKNNKLTLKSFLM